MPNPKNCKPLMALAPVTASSNPRRSKPFAIRSFPSFRSPAATSDAPPETSVAIVADQKPPPSPLITPPEEPTSCGPMKQPNSSEVPMPNPKNRKPLMALAPVTVSSNPRRSKPFAIRSFPSFRAPAATSGAPPETSFAIIADQKPPPSPLITPPPEEPTSRGSVSSFLSYRGKSFKSPIAFAIRKFPKGCGPLASVPKPSDEASIVVRRVSEEEMEEKLKDVVRRVSEEEMEEKLKDVVRRVSEGEMEEKLKDVVRRVSEEGMEEKLKDVVRRVSEEGRDLGTVSENGLVEESFGGRDGNSSVASDFVRDGDSLCRPEGSESDKIEEIEEKLTDILRRSSKEGSRLGKVFKKSAVRKSLGGEKPDTKSSLAPDLVKSDGKFCRPERSETMNEDENMKVKLNNERDGIGKVLKSDVVGSSLGEKDDTKPNRKRSLAPDRSEEGELLEVRGDRLIVIALMAASKCPWVQGKGKSSIVLQSTPKKQRIKASG